MTSALAKPDYPWPSASTEVLHLCVCEQFGVYVRERPHTLTRRARAHTHARTHTHRHTHTHTPWRASQIGVHIDTPAGAKEEGGADSAHGIQQLLDDAEARRKVSNQHESFQRITGFYGGTRPQCVERRSACV